MTDAQQQSHLHFRRRQQQLEGEEDATDLKLGPEFQNEHCLLYAEVKILLDKLKQQRMESQMTTQSTQGGENAGDEMNFVFNKTLLYVQQLTKFHNPETAKEVRKLLMDQDKLEPFELAQLANLLPEKADEARTLIPSLQQRTDEDDLQSLLNELAALQRFQS